MEEIQAIEKTPSRVTVLDSIELDKEIHNILKEQLGFITKYLPGGFSAVYEPELDVILRFVIWELSVGRKNATFGQQTLKLKYEQKVSSRKLRLLGMLNILSGYTKDKCISLLLRSEADDAQKVKKCIDIVEITLKALNILSLILFLIRGREPTFIEGFMGTTRVSIAPTNVRTIGYHFLTRELLWHGFVEMLMFMIPLVNLQMLKRTIRSLFCGKKETRKSHCKYSSTTRCAVCNEVPILPHQMGCAHAFCYYCIASNRLADSRFECPQCGYSDPSEEAMQQILFMERS